MSLPTPYYQDDAVTLYHGDCLDILPELDVEAVVVTDPPYGDTSLEWDRCVPGWPAALPARVRALWCFGSLRMFLNRREDFAGWKLAQDVVWEKHNGSGLHADRFRRVHELAVQWYRGEWATVYREPLKVAVDDVGRGDQHTFTRGQKPQHFGNVEAGSGYAYDGTRLQRSVLRVRSEHGRAEHPTQKPLGILDPLIRYSVAVDGFVLDPFAGSGSTLVAAKSCGRRAIGVELSEEYCALAARRLAQGVIDLGGAR